MNPGDLVKLRTYSDRAHVHSIHSNGFPVLLFPDTFGLAIQSECFKAKVKVMIRNEFYLIDVANLEVVSGKSN